MKKTKLLKIETHSEWVRKEPIYLEKTDKRYKKYKKQIFESGFSDSETWNLNIVIASFILPRLRWFRIHLNGYPGSLTLEKWQEYLDDMIFAFKCHITLFDIEYTKKDWKRCNKGLKLFAKYFGDLWN